MDRKLVERDASLLERERQLGEVEKRLKAAEELSTFGQVSPCHCVIHLRFGHRRRHKLQCIADWLGAALLDLSLLLLFHALACKRYVGGR